MYAQPLVQSPGRPHVPVADPGATQNPYPASVAPDAPIEVEDLRYSTVRLRVPFTSPSSGPLSRLTAETYGPWHIGSSKNFDIFYTLPVRTLADPTTRFDHLLVMFNGLNEIMPWHSALYDHLGHALADHGIVSVLLPTPFHLNRTPQRAGPADAVSHLLKKPTENPKPYSPYLNFYQSFLELDALLTLMRADGPSDAAADPFGFYRRFGGNTRISLFGFSMGGLRALATFLMDDQDTFHRCVLLCSGSRLEELSPPDVKHHEWITFTRMIEKVRSAELARHGVRDHEDFYHSLDAIFTKDNFGPLRDRLDTRRSRIKAVFGGSDETVSAVAVRRLGVGANVETIRGMRHLVMSDPNFEREFPRVVAGIAAFLKLSLEEPPTRNGLRDQCLSRLSDLGKDIAALTVADLLTWVREDEQLRGYYLSSKARFESDATLAESIRREGQRRPNR